MAFENVSWIWRKPTYFLIWLISTLVVAWLYIGALTNPEAYDALGWFFAVVFPILTGATLAVQVANYRERKDCPVSSTGGGLTGGILGIVTVACPVCPSILLGWIGLGAAVPSSVLGGPWLKLLSLVFLALALHWASSKK
jgi:hypothetical protein